jgi:hypothetical protein
VSSSQPTGSQSTSQATGQISVGSTSSDNSGSASAPPGDLSAATLSSAIWPTVISFALYLCCLL